jgi:Xaa-Pro aminopeptidase
LTEVQTKLKRIREIMIESGLGAVRLRGVDWFAWATAGGSSVVILTSETGIAEVLVTLDRALILTNEIERERLALEEVTADYEILNSRWYDPEEVNRIAASLTTGAKVASDRPAAGELQLPRALTLERLQMQPAEIERYIKLGADSAEAMTEALLACRPEWSEERLAGEGARALWSRGIHPTLVLVAGEERLERYRHPVATKKPIGRRSMMVFCGRRHGLYANLTRFVSFRPQTPVERERMALVAEFENAAFLGSRPGQTLEDVYGTVIESYRERGLFEQTEKQHFGGLTGYLSREAFARPGTADWPIVKNCALAWNPTLPGAKIEDTVLVGEHGLKILTADSAWPTVEIHGRPRPCVLEK